MADRPTIRGNNPTLTVRAGRPTVTLPTRRGDAVIVRAPVQLIPVAAPQADAEEEPQLRFPFTPDDGTEIVVEHNLPNIPDVTLFVQSADGALVRTMGPVRIEEPKPGCITVPLQVPCTGFIQLHRSVS